VSPVCGSGGPGPTWDMASQKLDEKGYIAAFERFTSGEIPVMGKARNAIDPRHLGLNPLPVYVPREGTGARAAVAELSGVVGTPVEGGRVLLDYEANMYGATNIRTFADKVHHAAGRHTWGEDGYPTRARTEVDAEEVIEVGRYDGVEVVLQPERREVVARWLGIQPDDLDAECRRTS
jgi:hypothetical protein